MLNVTIRPVASPTRLPSNLRFLGLSFLFALRKAFFSYACISDVVVTEGNIKFIASDYPTVSFTVVVKGVSVVGENVVAEVTSLVARISELEEKNTELNSKITELSTDVLLPISGALTKGTFTMPSGEKLSDYKKIKFYVSAAISATGGTTYIGSVVEMEVRMLFLGNNFCRTPVVMLSRPSYVHLTNISDNGFNFEMFKLEEDEWINRVNYIYGVK